MNPKPPKSENPPESPPLPDTNPFSVLRGGYRGQIDWTNLNRSVEISARATDSMSDEKLRAINRELSSPGKDVQVIPMSDPRISVKLPRRKKGKPDVNTDT